MLGQKGFNLCKYQTNGVNRESTNRGNTESIECSSDEDVSYARATLGASNTGDQQEQKVLGVRWNTSVDVLLLELSGIGARASLMERSKRNTIRAVGQVYDPMGLAFPVTIRMKMLLQDLYHARLSWDQPELLAQWRQMIKSLKRFKPISVSCHYFERSEGSVRKVRLCRKSASL